MNMVFVSIEKYMCVYLLEITFNKFGICNNKLHGAGWKRMSVFVLFCCWRQQIKNNI